jgi:sulfite exporter TauE/SafE
MTTLAAGLALGVASSAHCVAMCGPLLLMVSRCAAPTKAARLRQALTHHGGRILVYVLMAVPAGIAGEALTDRGFGRALALVTGALLLGAAAGSLRLPLAAAAGARVSAAVARLAAPALRWAASRPLLGPLATGALNGLLPCGMVYAALTAAGASGSVSSAVLLMTGFGVGTAATLVAMTMGAAAVPPRLRLRLRPVAPAMLLLAGAILIARGVMAPQPHAHQRAEPVSAPHHHH